MERKVQNSILNKEKNKVEERNMVPLSQTIMSRAPINDLNVLSDVYIKIYTSERSRQNAYYKAKICLGDGTEINPFKISHKYKSKKPDKIKDVDEIVFTGKGLKDLMKLIQNGEIGHFSSIKMYAQERSIEYQSNNNSSQNYYSYNYHGPPAGVKPIEGRHYFLNLILGAPGKKVKLGSTSRVKACKSCDTMPLRYTYDWVVQCDDLEEKICPYCNNPLEIVDRERKYVEVDLDFNAQNCKITGTNNQIGIIYQGRPIKTTVKVAALRNFLMNYQNLFPNNAIGPLDISIDIVKSRKGNNYVRSIAPSDIMEKIEWRPAILFPEDLISV